MSTLNMHVCNMGLANLIHQLTMFVRNLAPISAADKKYLTKKFLLVTTAVAGLGANVKAENSSGTALLQIEIVKVRQSLPQHRDFQYFNVQSFFEECGMCWCFF